VVKYCFILQLEAALLFHNAPVLAGLFELWDNSPFSAV